MIQTENLTGTVKRIIFSDPESGYCIFALAPSNDLMEVVAAGYIYGLDEEDQLELSGSFETTKNGRRFAVRSFRFLLPTNKTGLVKYLADGAFPGIGKITAERIVEKFGADTIAVLDETPERLAEVPRLPKKTRVKVTEAWREKRGTMNLSVFLHGVGLSPRLAPKILRRFGPGAAKFVADNPFELALEVSGIGFVTADRMAQALGVAKNSPMRCAAGLSYVLNEMTENGHSACPLSELVERTSTLIDVPTDEIRAALPILVERRKVALDRKDPAREPYVFPAALLEAEIAVAAGARALREGPTRLRGFDGKKAVDWLKSNKNIHLTKTQAEAVIAACSEKILVITGGPGTGKTTIVKAVLDILDVLKGRYVLAAPTGRAAKRLEETTGREAKTIHRLLELKPGIEGVRSSGVHIDADVLIIDEASMVDLSMTASLFAALSPDTHLVLVGDVDQLPSVGPGNVLADFIDCGRFRVVRLTEIFRQDERGLIVENAHRILAGKTLRLPEAGAEADFYFIKRDNPAGVVSTVLDLVANRLPKKFNLDPFSDVLVLSPMHKGETGIRNLNDRLQEALNPKGASLVRGERAFRLGDRVLQTSNDYDREIFNGDMGRVVFIEPSVPRLIVDFDGRRVPVEGAAFDDLVTAYAISVHKSQGSEYPAVIVVLSSQHYIMLQRNILYTAVTRARRLVVLVGSSNALRRCIDNSKVGARYGLLRERLSRI